MRARAALIAPSSAGPAAPRVMCAGTCIPDQTSEDVAAGRAGINLRTAHHNAALSAARPRATSSISLIGVLPLSATSAPVEVIAGMMSALVVLSAAWARIAGKMLPLRRVRWAKNAPRIHRPGAEIGLR